MDEFTLSTPVLVCRWRLALGRLPLRNRHLRALSQRMVGDKPLSSALLGWVRQHLEWTLEDGSRQYHDGTLMLVVDDTGKAAMSAGPYKPLKERSANDLVVRARGAQVERRTCGIAPEELWVVRDGVLMRASIGPAGGCSSLVADLAHTVGLSVSEDLRLIDEVYYEGFKRADEVFLASDEHGVVMATDRGGTIAERFANSYVVLVDKTRARRP